jgi:hypothetical protein
VNLSEHRREVRALMVALEAAIKAEGVAIANHRHHSAGELDDLRKSTRNLLDALAAHAVCRGMCHHGIDRRMGMR